MTTTQLTPIAAIYQFAFDHEVRCKMELEEREKAFAADPSDATEYAVDQAFLRLRRAEEMTTRYSIELSEGIQTIDEK